MKSFIKKYKFLHIIYNHLTFFYQKNISSYHIDKSNYFDCSVHFIGLKHIVFGLNNVISEGVWFNVNNRTYQESGIEVGDNCYIGKRNFFSSGRKIIIGDFFMSGVNCCILGSDHDFTTPFSPYIYTDTTNSNTIKIGDNVRLGANVTIIGNVTIGHGSIIGANTLVTKNIPPFSVVIGNPGRVIKRFDFVNNEWTSDFNELTEFMSAKDYKEILEKSKGRKISPFPSGKIYGDLFL